MTMLGLVDKLQLMLFRLKSHAHYGIIDKFASSGVVGVI